jgi:hypothetical protein
MSQEQKIDQILSQLEKMNRGLYGDSDNKMPGLMQRHYELKEDVDKLKEKEKRRQWIVYGGTTVLGFTAPAIIDWIKNLFK